jgi:hypothetical protein
MLAEVQLIDPQELFLLSNHQSIQKSDCNRIPKLAYEFPIRILARNTSKTFSPTNAKDEMISLITDNLVTWRTDTNMII